MEPDTHDEITVDFAGVSSILSVIGVIVILTLIIKLKTQSYFSTLLLYLSLSELIFAVSTLGCMHQENKGILADILGFLHGFGFYSKICWINCILVQAYLTINFSVRAKKYEIVSVCICFGMPLVVSMLILIFSRQAFFALLPGTLANDASNWIVKIIPMGITILTLSIVGTLVILKLAKEGFTLSKRADEAQNARDFLIFPLTSVLTWVPSIIFMSEYWKEEKSGQKNQSSALAAADGFFFVSQGLCNCLFYLFTYEIRGKIFRRRKTSLSTGLLNDDKEAPRLWNGFSFSSSINDQEEMENNLARAIPSLSRCASQRRGYSRRESFPNTLSVYQREGFLFPSRQISQRQESKQFDRLATISASEDQLTKQPHSCSEDNILDKSKSETEEGVQLARKPIISEGEKTKASRNLISTETHEPDEDEESRIIYKGRSAEEPNQFLNREQIEVEFIKTNIPFRCAFSRKSMQFQPDTRLQPFQKSAVKIAEKLEAKGLAEMGMVFGIDCTSSNVTSGKISFGGRPLHTISETSLNLYEQVIAILGSVAYKFSRKKHFPVYLFGDSKTQGYAVRPLYIDPDGGSHECYGVKHILYEYRYNIQNIKLSGPTSFKPLLEKAIEIVEVKGDFEVLVIIADAEPSDIEETRAAIIKAAEFPLEIIVVGVGDGNTKTFPKDPWLGMKNFEKSLPGRNFENFTFVQYEKGMSPEKFAEKAFKNLPSAYMYCYENELVEEKAESFHSV